MDVKPLTHRQRQALATRAQVCDAARRLFAGQGYVATTIAAIAAEADIPAPTIYSAFGSKAAILRAVADRAMATVMDGEDVWRAHGQAREHPDPARGLRLAARIQRRQFEAMYDVMAVHQEAARTDPEIAEATAAILAHRDTVFRAHLTAIAKRLKPGLTVEHGLAVYVTLVLPDVYRTLVLERGWTPDEYENWLGDAFVTLLLGTG